LSEGKRRQISRPASPGHGRRPSETGPARSDKGSLRRSFPHFAPTLKQYGLLARDPHTVERSKYCYPKSIEDFEFKKALGVCPLDTGMNKP